ncbi:MAG: hypothetical protein WA876_12780 [Candidatus Acidiferrales bacterium]
MSDAFAKNAARRLIALALLISPAESREWAAAMSAELEHVEGTFDTLSWAAGCLGTALKQLCLSFFSPRKHASDSSDREFFAGAAEVTMTKTVKTFLIAFAVASLLFLFAPTFRQALKVTAGSWRLSDSAWFGEMRSLGAKAEANHDAQTLAFVAMQMRYDTQHRAQRDKFADEAVAWDPRLTWIYYPLLSADRMFSPESVNPVDEHWLARLQAWDPTNAAVYSLDASYYRPPKALGWNSEADRAMLANSPHWLDAMAKAFSASNYDSYFSRKVDLDRAVAQRQDLGAPSHMFRGLMGYGFPDFVNFNLYANDFLLKSGEDLEAKGDFSHAEANYWKVTHLAQLIQLHGHTDLESLVAFGLESSASARLQALLQKSGNSSTASLLAFQAALAQRTASAIRAKHSQANLELSVRRAYVLQCSLLGIALSLLLILSCCAYFAARRLSPFGKTLRSGSLFAQTGIMGAVLLFASVVVMYFDYFPYQTAFQNYLAGSNPGDVYRSLLRFEVLEEMPSSFFYSFQRVYFWYTVIVLGGAIIAWILYRYIARTLHLSSPVHPVA